MHSTPDPMLPFNTSPVSSGHLYQCTDLWDALGEALSLGIHPSPPAPDPILSISLSEFRELCVLCLLPSLTSLCMHLRK